VPKLRRLRIDLAKEGVKSETLLEDGLDLPRINYGRCHERPYRYVWGVGVGDSGWLDHIVKADLTDRSARRWSQPGCYPGEPVFVAAPAANGASPSEDEGVLLSVVLDGERETSFLLVLDAKDLSELARAEMPGVMPLGFHGQFDARTTGRESEGRQAAS
jgi:carotenoid cleavage dioxygenase-like enzyme